MSRKSIIEAKRKLLSFVASTSLLTVPLAFALAEANSKADFSLFSSFGATERARINVQERARKKLMRVKQTVQKSTADDDTVSTETPTTMIAQAEDLSEADEIDVFPIVLAAPSQ